MENRLVQRSIEEQTPRRTHKLGQMLRWRSNLRLAKGNTIPPSRDIHDRTDRVHNDVWLIDCHNVTGPFGNDLTSAFRKRDLISLQVSPGRIGPLRTRHDHDRHLQFPPGSPDLRRALANMDDFVGGRLVSGGTEARRACESLRGRWQRLRSKAERNPEQSKDPD